ncbi:hypothetical protein K445DRAFT_26917 [Daldinia sp. EC12]|nr:hypothetical protein F4774DRAFT_426888 [Daldinia eschscholtzii]OTB11155.1 hypothetical protein K445DRAFT_26917 [Daldinia sp. EC12]
MSVQLITRFAIAKELGTNTIIVTANHRPASKLSTEFIRNDLAFLADFAFRYKPSLFIAYSFTCYSTIVNKWWKAWELVQSVDRFNFGLCLNVFHIASSWTYETELDQVNCIERLTSTVKRNKIFYMQVSSAVPPVLPLSANHPWYHPRETAFESWARNGKTFLFETTPLYTSNAMEELARSIIVGFGYRGFVTLETSTTTDDMGEDVPADRARRGKIAWKNFQLMLHEANYAPF